MAYDFRSMARVGCCLIRFDELPALESPIFTEAEHAYCRTRYDPVPSLAARFAAKTAARRALDLAEHENLDEIEIVRTPGQAPAISFGGAIAARVREEGLRRFWVSLSHSGHYAVALVVME